MMEEIGYFLVFSGYVIFVVAIVILVSDGR